MKTLLFSILLTIWVPFLVRAEAPRPSSIKTFKIFLKEGTALTLRDGELESKSTDKTFSPNGEIIFSIYGDDKARMIGNSGSADVTVIRLKSSIVFIENTPSGNMHVLTIFSTWNSKPRDLLVFTIAVQIWAESEEMFN